MAVDEDYLGSPGGSRWRKEQNVESHLVFRLRMTTVLHDSCQEHGLTRHLDTTRANASQQQGKVCEHWNAIAFVLKRSSVEGVCPTKE